MPPIALPPSALRKKLLDRMESYLSLSDKQSLSVGFYVGGQQYIIDFNNNESELSYDIGSVSKTVTAHLILSLKERGLVELSSPVSDYLDLKKGSYPTLYELLTHTAGYGHQTPLELTLPMLLRHRYSFRNPYENAEKCDVIKALERRNGKNKTHTYSYSDFPYAILALVAESVTGRHFSSLIGEFVKNDLGLSNTFVMRKTNIPPAIYRKKEIPYWKWNDDSPYLAAGGMVSNIYDMLDYVTLQTESEKSFITEGHKICESSFRDGESVGTTLSWHTYKNSDQLWHVGGVSTFRSSLIANRCRRLGVAVLGNSKGKRYANVHYIAKMLYSELKLKKVELKIN